MQFKRASAFFLSAVMCMGLAACQSEKTPTPEELLSGGGVQEAESIDADMDFALKAKLPMSELLPSDSDEPVDIGIEAKMNLTGTKELQKREGTLDVSYAGIADYSEDILSYVSTDTDGTVTTYTKDNDSGLWTYTVDDGTESNTGSIAVVELDSSLFKNLEMESVKTDDLVYRNTDKVECGDLLYRVTGDVPLAKFLDQTGMGSAEIGSVLVVNGHSSDTIDSGKFNAVLLYDGKTKQLMDMTLNLDPESVLSDKIDITDFSLALHVNKLNDSAVEIPADVLDGAVNATSLVNWDLDRGDSTGNSFDEFDDGSSDYDSYVSEFHEAEPDISIESCLMV